MCSFCCSFSLQSGKGGADLYHAVFGARVDVGVGGADVVEDVGHHGAVPGAHLVDCEVAVGEEGEFVVLDEVAGDGFAVVGLEQFGWGVPELADVGGGDGIEGVFEGGVVVSEDGLEFCFVFEGVEGKGGGGGEDDGGFGEVAVVGVVEAVCGSGGEAKSEKPSLTLPGMRGGPTIDEISDQHFHSLWPLLSAGQHLRCYHRIPLKLFAPVPLQEVAPRLPCMAITIRRNRQFKSNVSPLLGSRRQAIERSDAPSETGTPMEKRPENGRYKQRVHCIRGTLGGRVGKKLVEIYDRGSLLSAAQPRGLHA